MRSFFHFAFFLLYAFICYTDSQVIHGDLLPIPNVFISKFVWLTMVGVYLQTLYHFTGFAITVVSPNTRHPIYDYFSRIIGGLGTAVAFLFWGLFLFDPNTLMNDELGRMLMDMKWLNHGLHTLPLISSHLELLWKHTEFSRSTLLKGISVFCALYLIDIHYIHYVTGFWAYPILGQLPLPFRLVFFAACVFMIYLASLWLSIAHSLIHGSDGKPEKKIK